MFDVGFWEMLLLVALGLLILGPKKLPAIALKIGNYISKARTLVNSFSRQMRQNLHFVIRVYLWLKTKCLPSASVQQ